MAQRVQKTRSRGDFERDEELASEALNSGRVRTGPQRANVARDAFDHEPEEYTAEDLREQGEEPPRPIKTGAYEDDYGPGAEGLRASGMRSESLEAGSRVLPRKRSRGAATAGSEDFPTGIWSKQKTGAKIRKAKGTAPAKRPLRVQRSRPKTQRRR